MTVAELLDKPEKWCQGAYARNSKGKATLFDSDDATCWCMLGAICRCSGIGQSIEDAKLRVYKVLPKYYTFINAFNDDPSTTFEYVRRVIEQANI